MGKIVRQVERCAAATGLFWVMGSSPALAGAWNQPAGDGQIILTSLWTSGDFVFADNGDRTPIMDFSKTESRLFAEYGVSDRWTLTANAAYQTINYDSPDSAFTFKDFDETELGLRYQVKRKRGQAISVQASYIWDGGPMDNILDIGGDRDMVELRGLWGQSWETSRGDFFTDAQIAGRMETGGRYQSTSLDVTLGYKPTDKWMIMLQNYTRHAEAEEALGFRVPAQAYLKSHASITYRYKAGQRLQLGYVKTLLGKNIVQEGGFTLGVWWEY
ncbi:hypothetical protein ACJ3XI_04555 [Litorimonas sp. RW-G-Af-16]|uniref:hypothetical protein n=1 Tax=Litorimonas sp. RW-G-Af-16 TaxID=3241168 RepID=UPI00390CB9FC